jgi:hypothetical protein
VIGGRGAKLIGEMLKFNSSLVSLDLVSDFTNHVGGKPFFSLALTMMAYHFHLATAVQKCHRRLRYHSDR